MSWGDPPAALIEFFVRLWRADRRPEAHRFVIGRVGLIVGLAALGALLIWFLYPESSLDIRRPHADRKRKDAGR